MILIGIVSLVFAMVATWVVTPLVIRLAHGLGALDLPGARKIHDQPVPRIGGLAVYLGFLAGLALAGYLAGTLGDMARVAVYRGLTIAATGMLVAGLIDDLWGLSFRWKFAAQIAAASYVWTCGFQIENVTNPLGGTLHLGVWSLPLTVLWIVGITNAVNLIDGLDGLATGTALITTAAVAVIAVTRAEIGTAGACVALAGSLVGFLYYNFNPARIFLGDSGSMFLGFVLAVTAVRGSQKGTTAVALIVPLLVLGLPVLDTSLAILRRLNRLRSRGARSPNAARYVLRNLHEVFLPDRGHIHHRLLEIGLSHRRAVVTLYAVAVAFALCAFGLVLLHNAWLATVLVGALASSMAGFFVLLYLRLRKRWQAADAEKLPRAEFAAQPPEEALAASSRRQAR
jgi:UDP-GlcNAc:undecaprenyl-phosphate GlcNAc-1-phosphate transferase